MKTLVTGATGFLGSHLAAELVHRGEDVRALVRSTSRVEHLQGLDLELMQGDLTEPNSLLKAVEEVNRVFHCAALVDDWGSWSEFRQANVHGVRNLLEASLRTDLSRFVYASTTGVYGYRGGTGCDERSPYRKRGFLYSDTKIEGEQKVWHYYRKKDVPVTVIRPVNIYGPRCGTFVLRFVGFLKAGYMIFIDGGRHVAGLSYVDNVVQAMILASERQQSIGQAYNISDGLTITWRQYVAKLAEILGVEPFTLSLPHSLAYVVAWAMEIMAKLLRLRRPPLATRNVVELVGTDQNFPIDKACRELDYKPQVGFEAGMGRIEAWLRDAGCVKT